MNIVLLDTLTFGDADLSGFDKLGDVVRYENTTLQQIKERVSDAEIIVTNKVVITKEIMRSAKNLKLICVAATGVNNIDIKAADELNIKVKNVSGYSTDSVVEHTFAMLFYLTRHLRYYDEAVKGGFWSKSEIFCDLSYPYFEISGKKWGIVGLGTIGKRVAYAAKAFGCDVSYYSTSGKHQDDEFQSVTLEELLSSSDIISVHAPLNKTTKNLLAYEGLSTCKDNAVILNLGRGGIVNEEDVAKLIDEKDIFFGLDVLENEPMHPHHPLLNVKNRNRLFITPHIAWASRQSRERLINGVLANIKESVQS